MAAAGVSALVALGGAITLASPSATPAVNSKADKPLGVVTTVSMLADTARAIGGSRVDVVSLLGEGVDPHLYRPTRTDISRLSKADLIIANGLFLEAQLDDTLKALGRSRPVVFAAERVPAAQRLAAADYADRPDPHVWMDPRLWSHVVDAVRDALTERDPKGREVFAAGAEAYKAELTRVDTYARELVATLPENQRLLITAHDAFAYFGQSYGFEVEGIQGISTESEAGLRRIEELVNLVIERGIKAVFFESSVPARNVRALVEGAAARGHKLVVGGELYSDSLGTPGTYEGTLIGMLDHNVTTIVRALGGRAPVAGMAGRLKAGG